jgi:hypothetical protein
MRKVELLQAHKHSYKTRSEVLLSETCGCFFCLRTFKPALITDWVDETDDGVGQTALCPYCGIDAVIGDRSGFAIDPEFLAQMQSFWFTRSKPQRFAREFFKPLYRRK